jgi:hypothetical protein
MTCLACEDTGWVCENHPDQPWEGPHASLVAEPVHLAPAAMQRPLMSRRASQKTLSQMASNGGWPPHDHVHAADRFALVFYERESELHDNHAYCASGP